MTIALVGNPNSGKSTLFNTLSGAHRHTGNYPGVTVDCASSRLPNGATLVDLPGIYSLTPFSADEAATLQYLPQADIILNILDASRLERNLYLTQCLLELGKPMVVALNMGHALLDLPCPVVPIDARNRSTLSPLLLALEHPIAPQPSHHPPPPDDETAAETRYRIIETMVKSSPLKPAKTPPPVLSLLGFAVIFAAVFWLTFGPAGSFCTAVFARGLAEIAAHIDRLLSPAPPFLQGLIADGVCAGVFPMLGFLPMILILFFLFSLMEDSGLMARAAFITDKLMSKIGLDGRAFFPFLIGFGCTVPAILSVRTLQHKQERRLAAFVLPFMSCTARIPIYGVFTAAFFPNHRFAVIGGLYGLGVMVAVICTFLLKHLPYFAAKETTFLMEIPPWRRPTIRNTVNLLRERTMDFLKRAFGIVLATGVVLWGLQSLGKGFSWVTDPNESALAAIAGQIAPIFAPLGFDDWRATASLISGFAAKETVVSTLSVLVGDVTQLFTPASALTFMVFSLLYCPCAAAFAATRREVGNAAFMYAAGQTAVAWGCAWVVARLF